MLDCFMLGLLNYGVYRRTHWLRKLATITYAAYQIGEDRIRIFMMKRVTRSSKFSKKNNSRDGSLRMKTRDLQQLLQEATYTHADGAGAGTASKHGAGYFHARADIRYRNPGQQGRLRDRGVQRYALQGHGIQDSDFIPRIKFASGQCSGRGGGYHPVPSDHLCVSSS